MSDSSSDTAGVHVLRLDPSLYKLGDEEAAFFKQTTGIKDSDELKQHILQVQKEAYAVRAVTCPRPSRCETETPVNRCTHTLALVALDSQRQ